MAKFPFLLAIVMLLLLFMTTINQSFSARTLGNNSTPNHNHNHNHHRIIFLMPYMLNTTQPSQKPTTTKGTNETPFKKPLGFFPIPQNIPTLPTTSSSTQSLDLSTIAFSFPTRATLQDLKLGSVTSIDEDLVESDGDKLHKLGKAQGVYVASSEGGSNYMVAITASFVKGEYQNGLRLFGMHRSDVFESHVAVIGGSGKYYGANGYAAVKVVDKIGSNIEGKVTSSKFLLFDVYLS